MKIIDNMQWPPRDTSTWKMREHSAWFSGSAEQLANFYAEYERSLVQGMSRQTSNEMFWERQISNQGEKLLHIPVANDISETSANLLFAESPLIRFKDSKAKMTEQKILDDMLEKCGLFPKLLEAAECSSGLGGIFVKIAWDSELSEFPIPVIVQADKSIPEFKFGMLSNVIFWSIVKVSDDGNKIHRLLEKYERGQISYQLWYGTADRLGHCVDLNSIEETQDLEDIVSTPDVMLAFYIPNMLPNRLDRSSYAGRSDYSGIEGMMDALDEAWTAWMVDIDLARASILLPEAYLKKMGDRIKFNRDRMLYVKLDIDPLDTNKITPNQFDIRSEQFGLTCTSLLERIVTSAGYSPQSFGLNIEGRAESGTALNIRERKSFQTKGKKENYWGPAIRKIIEALIIVYGSELGGKLKYEEINVSFSDGNTNDIAEKATSLKMLHDAVAVSVDTKVRMLHPEWDESQIQAEVQMIIDENALAPLENPDLTTGFGADKKEEEDTEE